MSTRAEAQDALPKRVAAKLFLRLAEQFGDRMADMFASSTAEAVQQQWSEVLAGYAPEELARGLMACRQRVFPPHPAEFARLCRPSLDPELAWLEAVDGQRERREGRKGEWSHPAVWRASCAMSFELRTRAYSDCAKRWAWVLQKEHRAGWGEPVPMPALQIVADVKVGAPPAAVRERMAQILASAGRGRTNESTKCG
ncbi:hypothetical protein ASE76_01100 [Xylophilus sp. Leaf220]|nr:hypothetical protein ASE76_01100 [Xylophilus sp. Leaf220]